MVRRRPVRRIRYAVAGLGYITQTAVLPAFSHAANSELAALISDDPVKRRALARRYRVPFAFGYDDLEDAIERAGIDALFVALPNHLHRDFTVRAAGMGVHVLCEKPMAVTAAESLEMIRAADRNGVRLMIAYRLHFERSTLESLRIARSGRLGELRFLDAVLAHQVRDEDNIRLNPRRQGGGPLYDLGVYCINAARMLFQAEPVEASALEATRPDRRFQRGGEMVCGLLRFPGERLATFTCSNGSADLSEFRITGTRGTLCLDPAFDYTDDMEMEMVVGERSKKRTYPARDQFGPELVYFSDCLLRGREPEPNGWEGLADVRVIEALYESIRRGKAVRLPNLPRERRPSLAQEIHRPPVEKPGLIRVDSPRGNSP